MFADVVGSTHLYDILSDAEAKACIDKCLTLMIDIIHQHEGTLVKTIGDEILCRFDTADAAIQAACSIQETIEKQAMSSGDHTVVRIGLHFGDTIVKTDDVFGDVVNVAARMTHIAKGGQIITTKNVVDLLNPANQNKTRKFDHIAIKGKQTEFTIYDVIWEKTDFTLIGNLNLAENTITTQLKIEYHNITQEVTPSTPSLSFGRSQQCDIVVNADLISRVHAILEYRRGKFILIDQSTNGTFIKTQDNQEVYFRREEVPLWRNGVISLGQSIHKSQEHLISFTCL